MEISVNKLLDKMALELAVAQRAESEAKIREKVQAIKVLCELILDEVPAGKRLETGKASQPGQQRLFSQADALAMPQEKPMKLDDANGESIFDF